MKRQMDMLGSFGLEGGSNVGGALALRADCLDCALIAEAIGAEGYWDEWAHIPIEFASRVYLPV